jgi:nitroimidazol reductase NimA-like FMN-containing flavoprotein (pyridoxamine 5'-phosphate oxidase superfamily)
VTGIFRLSLADMPTPRPVFRELTRADAVALLQRHRFGRIAFTFHDRVDIEPIHFVYHDDWIYGRTAPGTKLSVLTHHPWAAFEVDEVRSDDDWRSVVAKGAIFFLDDDTDDAYEHALAVIRRAAPHALTDDDPTPERTILFRMHVDELHGRAASSGDARADP